MVVSNSRTAADMQAELLAECRRIARKNAESAVGSAPRRAATFLAVSSEFATFAAFIASIKTPLSGKEKEIEFEPDPED